MWLNGIEIISSPYIVPTTRSYQYRFPKSKKKRIRLKWRRRKENWKTVMEEHFIKWGDKIIVSKKHFEQLKNEYPLDTAVPR